MKTFGVQYLFVSLGLLVAQSTTLFAADVRVAIDFKDEAPGNAPLTFSGRMTVEHLDPGEVCFYTRLNDSDSRRFNIFARRYQNIFGSSEQTLINKGFLEVTPDKGAPPVRWIGSTVFAIKDPGRSVALSFQGHLPEMTGSSATDRFYEQIYPTLLASCPSKSEDWIRLKFHPGLKNQVAIKIPPSLQYSGMGTQKGNQVDINYRGSSLAFNLSKTARRKLVLTEGVPIHIDYEHEDFLQLEPVITRAVSELTKWLGPYPYNSLTVVETSELQNYGHPGIVTIDWPKQEVFRSLQSQWLNWREWVAVSQIAAQWMAAAIKNSSADDFWLTLGTTDFLTHEVLKDDPNRFNLFNTLDSNIKLFSLNYLQFQDITAAYFYQKEPNAVLTDDAYRSVTSFENQHSLIFIKQALTLRYLKYKLGDTYIRSFLRAYYKQQQFQFMTPANFAQFLGGFQKTGPEALHYLREWWLKPGFPDLKLASYDYEKTNQGKYKISIEVERRGEQDIPADVLITDVDGNKTILQLQAKPNSEDLYVASGILAAKPDLVVVDPDRDMFDGNRFDNASSWSKVNFFPGNAKGLLDDGYTILWVPYAFRRPGESYTLGIQSTIFRYIQNNWFLKFEGMPAEKKSAFEVRYEEKVFHKQFTVQASATQNYLDETTVQSGVRKDFTSFGLNSGFGLQLRYRDFKNEHESRHISHAWQMSISPRDRDSSCSPRVGSEFEHAPQGWAKDLSYRRWKANAGVDCSFGWFGEFSAKSFYGDLQAEGEVPEAIAFQINDGYEAGIRTDFSPDTNPRRIYSFNFDQKFPLGIPFPGNSFILSRQVRWQVFFDHGKSLDRDELYQAGGTGIYLPLGGDLMGSGSLAVTKLSFMWILYQRSGDEFSHQPSFLFNIAGSQ